MAEENEVEDRIYKWEIEPHPYDADFDVFVTDDDAQARQAVLDAAEKQWDNMSEGDESRVIIRMNAAPTTGDGNG